MAMSKTALEGVRVLDLGRYQAGPRIGLVLARLGAEVIKVEAPGGDESRALGPKVRGQSAYWVQYNSGKKSLGLNMRTAKGKEIVGELVKPTFRTLPKIFMNIPSHIHKRRADCPIFGHRSRNFTW